MFSLFKSSPINKLKKEYSQTLEQAMQAQRKGDIRLYSELTDKSELILKKITEIESNNNSE